MTINICWVDKPLKPSDPVKITTDVAVLVVYQVDGVITKTEWQLELPEDESFINRQWLEIQRYLNNPDSDLSVNLYKQGSEYRNKIWNEICKIPAGEVLSYTQLAKNVDSGARAVANACRDNPLPKASRSATRGLTRVKSPAGTLIAFSTSPGETASDGEGRNGIYTKYLLHYMKMPNLPIESVLKGVSRSVKKATANKQMPWVETSFDGEFSFFAK